MSEVRKDNSSADTRPYYAQIGDQLRDRIAVGDYAVGSILPTEGKLCEEFSTSRHTVREALRLLADAGLIERRQGSGSRVLTATVHQKYVHDMRSLDQLFQYASDTRFIINEMRVEMPESALFPEIGVDSTEWLIVRGLRLERDEDIPICVSTVLVNSAYAGIAEELEKGSGAIYRQIENKFGIEVSQVVQDITVTPMPVKAACLLDRTTADVAVEVRRRYLGVDGTIFLVSVNHHPADRFSYTMQLRREGVGGTAEMTG